MSVSHQIAAIWTYLISGQNFIRTKEIWIKRNWPIEGF
jgi:hypothetical protein